MYILHIETSTKVCSVALSRDKLLLGLEETTEGMNHAALLSPMINTLLKKANVSTHDLEAVSISSGPGSYTGLRVGGSTAKAFSYSLEIPLVAVPTLEALAHAARLAYPDATHFLPMLDARRNEVFSSLFDRNGQAVWPDSSVIVDQDWISEELADLGQVVCCGDGAFKLKPYLSEYPNLLLADEIVCSARHLIGPALDLLTRDVTENPLHFVPSYLKPPNITQPRNSN
jgi:tRNA threonylcarbamoyladenosine biosynthesis protein TsaB